MHSTIPKRNIFLVQLCFCSREPLPYLYKKHNTLWNHKVGGTELKKLISVVLIAVMLLLTTAAVVIAAENATHEASEKENTIQEQAEKNLSATQKVTEEVRETANKTKEAVSEKRQPGFEAIFAAVGILAVAFIGSKRRS